MAWRRAPAALLVVSLLFAPLVGSADARAQPVSENQERAEEAEARKAAADRLVSDAVANRDAVEAELLSALEAYQTINVQLGRVNADVDRLRERIGQMGSELRSAETDLSTKAVEAYMRAVASPQLTMWTVGGMESAMVAERAFELLSSEDQHRIARITVAQNDLGTLQQQYTEQQTELFETQSAADAEADRLAGLFAAADLSVGSAIAESIAADVAFRMALDDLDQAQAKEEQQRREEERRRQATTTTTTTTTTTPTTASSESTTTTTTIPAGPRIFKPAVERWRNLVAAYFPTGVVEEALAVMSCESGGDPNAYNPYSGASGLFQFLPGTWAVASIKAGFGGESPFEAEANIASAAWLGNYYTSVGKSRWAPWGCKP